MKIRILVVLALWCRLLPAMAGLETFDFSGNVDEDRYKALISEVRCLVCQNQSLADSDAELAHDLRLEVYEQMQQGKDNDEVIDFLVARYGDFVLYNPPVKPSTYLLWYGPFIMLALGLFMLIKNVRQRSRQADAALSKEEQARIDALLGKNNDKEQDQ
jgi:cytochrome c-type biogenesis protein CcmH